MAEWASEKIPTNKSQRDCKIDNYPNASNDKLLISGDNTVPLRNRASFSGDGKLITAQLLGGRSLLLNAKLLSSTPTV